MPSLARPLRASAATSAEDLGGALDDGDLDAHVAPEVGELEADGAGAEDGDRGGLHVADDGLTVGEDALAVGLHAREEAGAGAGGHHDVVGGDDLIADGHLAAAEELGLTGEVGDAVLLEQAGDAALVALGHLAGAGHHRREVDADLGDGEAVVAGVAGLGGELGRLQEGLAGDASPVEADAAEVLLLDTGGLQAELAGADGGGVAAGTGTDDEDLVVGHVDLRRAAGRGSRRSGAG